LVTVGAYAEKPFNIVQSTPSSQDTGLFEYLLPKFTDKTGIDVRVVALGTGQTLKNSKNGDGDVVLVHSKPDEDKFVAGSGFRQQATSAQPTRLSAKCLKRTFNSRAAPLTPARDSYDN
jgi:ABC-type tungstate transport system permease subunit